jgi:predicted RNA binding protein YcfA (HicA-like mRNA interferase family)
MPKLKILSGVEIIKIFAKFDFKISSQTGSHVKLVRILLDGTKQPLTIPYHKELDKGTLKAIFRQALRYIQEEDLKPYFYSK